VITDCIRSNVLTFTPVGATHLPITALGRCDWWPGRPGRRGRARPSRRV